MQKQENGSIQETKEDWFGPGSGFDNNHLEENPDRDNSSLKATEWEAFLSIGSNIHSLTTVSPMPAYDTRQLTPWQRVSTFMPLPKAKARCYSVRPQCIPHFLVYYSLGPPLASSQLSRDILSWLLTQLETRKCYDLNFSPQIHVLEAWLPMWWF